MWIPDPRWENPQLLKPGAYPAGSVVLDKAHPLAPDKGCWFAAPSGYVEISTINSFGAVPEFNRVGFDYSQAGGEYSVTQEERLDHGDMSGNSWTVLSQFKSGGSNGSLFSKGGTGALGFRLERNFSRWGFRTGSLIGRSNVVDTTVGVDNVWTVRLNTTQMTVWVNGVDETDGSNDGYSDPGEGLSDWIAGNGSTFGGLGGLIMWHSWELTDEEIRSLHRNPYQFLIPA